MSLSINQLAQSLELAQKERRPCAPLSDTHPNLSVDDAYAIQQNNIAARVEKGARVIGYKVGITSEAIQNWLNVSEPDFGVLLDEMEVGDGDAIDTQQLLQPRVEGEVAFVLKSDLEGTSFSRAEIISAVDYALPAIEIIDSRIADWKIKYEDTIADNASSARFVLGTTPVKLSDIDLVLAGMRLSKNGAVVSTGVGAACLNNPINALLWLANTLGKRGVKLKAGSVILSGALGKVSDVKSGDFVDLAISQLGHCRVRFR